MTLKCKSRIHYYRTMATGAGHNPAPYCHLWEDTGRTPNILTQECYEKRKPPKRQKGTKK